MLYNIIPVQLTNNKKQKDIKPTLENYYNINLKPNTIFQKKYSQQLFDYITYYKQKELQVINIIYQFKNCNKLVKLEYINSNTFN